MRRLGRLRAIEPTRIVLDQGTLPADHDTLYVDCSASAIKPLFSAALIAFVESHVGDATERKALAGYQRVRRLS